MGIIDWVYGRPLFTPKETKVAFVLKGVWKRKVIERPDQQTLEREKQLANLAPWTIITTPGWAAQYVDLYGQDEFDVLKASRPNYNMVASYVKPEWVKDGQWVPFDPKPDAGETNVFGYKPGSAQPAEVAGLSDAAMKQLSQLIYERCWDAVQDAFTAEAKQR
jgi:hypothetical protein